MGAPKMAAYQYTECGLDNVIIEGISIDTDDEGDECVEIPHIHELHRSIAEAIINHKKGMSGDELRFLRTEMGMTQAELAKLVHRERLTVSRWERGEGDIDSTGEALVRIQAADMLGITRDESIQELSERCVPTTQTQPIVIETQENESYRAKAA